MNLQAESVAASGHRSISRLPSSLCQLCSDNLSTPEGREVEKGLREHQKLGHQSGAAHHLPRMSLKRRRASIGRTESISTWEAMCSCRSRLAG